MLPHAYETKTGSNACPCLVGSYVAITHQSLLKYERPIDACRYCPIHYILHCSFFTYSIFSLFLNMQKRHGVKLSLIIHVVSCCQKARPSIESSCSLPFSTSALETRCTALEVEKKFHLAVCCCAPRPHDWLSMLRAECASLSQSQPVLASFSQSQPVFASPSQSQPVSASFSQSQPVSASFSQFQPAPASLSQFQPVSASLSQSQPGPASPSQYVVYPIFVVV